MRVIAVSFKELLMLKQIVQVALEALLRVPDEDQEVTVTFRWMSDGLDIVIRSANLNRLYSRDAPQGVSTHEWAVLVSEELKNHLLSGNRFIVRDLMYGDKPKQLCASSSTGIDQSERNPPRTPTPNPGRTISLRALFYPVFECAKPSFAQTDHAEPILIARSYDKYQLRLILLLKSP